VVDVRKRITINQILKQPIIAKRIKQFLNDNTFKNEFSHTILHNQQVKLHKDLLYQGPKPVQPPAKHPLPPLPAISPQIKKVDLKPSPTPIQNRVAQ
jgi:hypothetical protein